MKILTTYVKPPVPSTCDDFSAIDSDTYEAGQPVGRGATEPEAVADLLEQQDSK